MSIDPVTGGGTAERTVKLARYLASSGVDSALLTLDTGIDAAMSDSLRGVRLHLMDSLNKRFYIPRLSFKHLSEIVACADVVHLMNHWTVINALVYAACRKLDKPYVVCPAGALPIFGRSAALKKIYNLIIGKEIIQNAWGHIAIPVDEILQFEPYAVSPEKVTVIPNGIDPSDFLANDTARFREKFNLPDKPLILFLGRLNLIKGPDLLLEAFSLAQTELSDYHLVFAGPDGGMLAELERLTAEFFLQDRVHFPGYIGGDDKSRAYHAAELLVIPSRQEAMSIVALEAGISGTPVLLTDRCGFDQVAEIGGGMVVKPSAEALKSGLLTLCTDPHGSGKLRRMGQALRDYVGAEYTWSSVVEKYIQLYRRILSGGGTA